MNISDDTGSNYDIEINIDNSQVMKSIQDKLIIVG